MMTIDRRGEVHSDLAIPPGETLADEIASRGMSRTELAARLGLPVQVVHEIVQGKKAIAENTALGLERVLGIPVAFWVNLEGSYQMLVEGAERYEAPAAESAPAGPAARNDSISAANSGSRDPYSRIDRR